MFFLLCSFIPTTTGGDMEPMSALKHPKRDEAIALEAVRRAIGMMDTDDHRRFLRLVEQDENALRLAIESALLRCAAANDWFDVSFRHDHFERSVCGPSLMVNIQDKILKRFAPIALSLGASTLGQVRFKLLGVGPHGCTTGQALTEIERQGLVPGTYEQLLGFARKFTRDINVVALGSMAAWRRRRYAAVLGYDDGMRYVRVLPRDTQWITREGRCIDLADYDSIWRQGYRLLAVYPGG